MGRDGASHRSPGGLRGDVAGRVFRTAAPDLGRHDRGVSAARAPAGGRHGCGVRGDLHAGSIVQPSVAEIRDGFADLPVMGAHRHRILLEIELKSRAVRRSLRAAVPFGPAEDDHHVEALRPAGWSSSGYHRWLPATNTSATARNEAHRSSYGVTIRRYRFGPSDLAIPSSSGYAIALSVAPGDSRLMSLRAFLRRTRRRLPREFFPGQRGGWEKPTRRPPGRPSLTLLPHRKGHRVAAFLECHKVPATEPLATPSPRVIAGTPHRCDS
jgi:hypothetical protein